MKLPFLNHQVACIYSAISLLFFASAVSAAPATYEEQIRQIDIETLIQTKALLTEQHTNKTKDHTEQIQNSVMAKHKNQTTLDMSYQDFLLKDDDLPNIKDEQDAEKLTTMMTLFLGKYANKKKEIERQIKTLEDAPKNATGVLSLDQAQTSINRLSNVLLQNANTLKNIEMQAKAEAEAIQARLKRENRALYRQARTADITPFQGFTSFTLKNKTQQARY